MEQHDLFGNLEQETLDTYYQPISLNYFPRSFQRLNLMNDIQVNHNHQFFHLLQYKQIFKNIG